MANNKYPKYTGPEVSQDKQKLTREEIKQRFDNETASLYSQRKPEWLPEFEFTFSLVPKLLKPFVDKKSKILDLGAGTGNLSRTIFESIPELEIELVDFSENMLSEVKSVLKPFEGKYSVTRADIFETSFSENNYNGIVSSFAIHHARGEDTYKKTYQNIYNSLTSPGIFICCDVIDGANNYLSSLNESGWTDFLEKNGFQKKDILKIIDNYHREDSPLSVPVHLRLLSEVGFKEVDLIWKKYNFGIYVAIK